MATRVQNVWQNCKDLKLEMEIMKKVVLTKNYLQYFQKLIESSKFTEMQAIYHLSSWTSPYENRTIIYSLMTSFENVQEMYQKIR